MTPQYLGPVPNPNFVNIWELHKKLSGPAARREYEWMYMEWLKERDIKHTPSRAAGYAGMDGDEVIVGFYIYDTEAKLAFKLTFGL